MALAKSKTSGARRSDDKTGERSVSDPYRWMEEDTPALRSWVQAQHEYTMAQLLSLPAREGIRARLEELMRAPARQSISKAGKRYFFRQRGDDQELSALYCQDEPNSAP